MPNRRRPRKGRWRRFARGAGVLRAGVIGAGVIGAGVIAAGVLGTALGGSLFSTAESSSGDAEREPSSWSAGVAPAEDEFGTVPPAAELRFTAGETERLRATGVPWARGAPISGATHNRLILFSFDDGPSEETTPRLLEVLDRLDVRALFFVTGEHLVGPGPRARRQRELVREMVRRGHIIGNHTLHHRQLPLLSDLDVIAEVEGTERILTGLLGARPWLVRVPGGARSRRVDRILADRGYTQVLWNLGSGDFQVRTAEEVLAVWTRVLRVRERDFGERGGIVLLHDLHPWSVEALPRMVAHLRQRNCALLAEGETLYDIVDDPALFFAPVDPNDPSAAAPAATVPPAILEARQRRLRDAAQARCAPH